MSDSIPVKVDLNNIPPEAPDGAYTARCKACKRQATREAGHPMLVLEFVDLQPLEGQEVAEDATVTAFIVVAPAEDRKAHTRGLKNLKACLKAFGIAAGEVDLDELCAQLAGQECRISLKSKADRSGEMRLNVNF